MLQHSGLTHRPVLPLLTVLGSQAAAAVEAAQQAEERGGLGPGEDAWGRQRDGKGVWL